MEQEEKDEFRAVENPKGFDFDLGLMVFIIRKSLIWILLVLGLAAGSAYTVIHYSQPVYESKTILQISSENRANQLLEVENIYESEEISKDIEVLRSQEFFKRVLDTLPLDISYYFEGEVLRNERFKNNPYSVEFSVKEPTLYDKAIYVVFEAREKGSLNYEVGGQAFSYAFTIGDTLITEHAELVIQDAFMETIINSAGFGETDMYFVLNSPMQNLKTLYPSYVVQLLSASAKTILISVSDHNPAKAANICNQIAFEYLEFDKEHKNGSAKLVLKFINEQLADVYNRLKDSETLIKDFKKENRMSESDFAESYIKRLEEHETSLSKLEVQAELLKRLKKTIDDENTGVDINNLLPVLAGSDFERKVESQILDLQRLVVRRNNKLSTDTRENPNILIYDQQIESQKTLILKSLIALQEKLLSAIDGTKGKIREIDQNFMDLPSKEIEYARLQRVYNSNEKYYTLLLEKKTEYSISEAGYISDNNILQRASKSTTPVSPRKTIIYASAMSIALTFTIALLLIRYFMNNNISGMHDLSRLINPKISILGVVPKYNKNIPMSQLIVDKRPKSIMAESFRSLRTNLEFFESTDETKVIAVTSTVSGEGKTLVAINLGGILAFSGKKVIILDLDM